MKLILVACGLSVSALACADDKSDLQAELARYTTFDAGFVQAVSAEDGTEIQRSEGRLQLMRPGKIRWQQASPEETLFVSNGTVSYYFDSFAEQVTVMDSARLVDSTPFVLLASNDSDNWQKYSVIKQGESYQITPNEGTESQVVKLELAFSGDRGFKALAVYDASGQVSKFDFADARVNLDIDNGQFEFAIPADVAVDDQRQRD